LFKTIRVRASQGTQYIPDPRQANPVGLRGRPLIGAQACEAGCNACVAVCPTQAITSGAATGDTANAAPVAIDLGRCVVCGDCEPVCPSRKLSFDNQFKLATTERSGLMLTAARPAPDPVKVSATLRARFGRSLKLRSVSAGGCNGCELEVNALSNVNFDIGRYGIDIVASPRHADGLVLTGPISRNMAQALQLCWDGMPEPKLVIAVGACAISGSPFEAGGALDRRFLESFKPSLYVPGCPAHPLTFISGILDLLGIES
jgi:Ni,Fe-hydrogenase III small subunit/NAD-dependent dihydropyrimidine dehydrogenase PreA subunit